MVYGVINERGEKLYTYLSKLFESIDNAQLDIILQHRCRFGGKIQKGLSAK